MSGFVSSFPLMKPIQHLIVAAIISLALPAPAKLPPTRLIPGAGLSQPMFDYASPSLSKGCFTQSGLQLETVASMNVFRQWWWDVRFVAQMHPVDVERLGYERVIDDPFLVDTYIRSEPYRHLGLLTGPGFMFDNGHWWYAQASLMAGLMQSKTPYQLHKPTYFMTGPEYFEISSATDYAIAYGGELAAGWKVTPCYHLRLSASFLHTEMNFRFLTSGGIRTDNRRISTLNLSAGLVFLIPSP